VEMRAITTPYFLRDARTETVDRLRMKTAQPNAILIDIGNAFRSDDGAGPAIVGRLQDQLPPGIKGFG
jgi:hypothetical protein